MLKYFIESHSNDLFFIRNSFRRYVYMALFLLVLNGCLITFLYFNLLTVAKTQYFATTSDGRIINIYPEN